MKLILDIVKHPQEKLLKRNFQFNKTGGVVGRSDDIDNKLADTKILFQVIIFNTF